MNKEITPNKMVAEVRLAEHYDIRELANKVWPWMKAPITS